MDFHHWSISSLGWGALVVMVPSLLFASDLKSAASSHDMAQPGAQASEIKFAFGDNCERLKEMSWEDVVRILQWKNQVEWANFCQAEEPAACDDYSHFFEGFGFLSGMPQDATTCRFHPYHGMRVPMPMPQVYHDYG